MITSATGKFNDAEYEFVEVASDTSKKEEINTLVQENIASQIPANEATVDLTTRLITAVSSSEGSTVDPVILTDVHQENSSSLNKATTSEQDVDSSCAKFIYDTTTTIYSYIINNNNSKKDF